jgi:hypothetical protein
VFLKLGGYRYDQSKIEGFGQKQGGDSTEGDGSGFYGNIIDNAYKTFYQKNKEKDIYNIKLNLGDCGSLDSNNIMNNFNYENKYESIKEEEFSTNEKNKIAQVTSLYKNNGQKYINDEKSPGKKYLQKISPSKNYFFNKNLIHSKNNFQLPVILKATAYNNHAIFNHKKYNNFY